MWMGIGLIGHTVGCPARMSNTDIAFQGIFKKTMLEIDKFAFSTPAFELAAPDGGDPRPGLTAILKASQCLDQRFCHCIAAQYSNNSAHTVISSSKVYSFNATQSI